MGGGRTESVGCVIAQPQPSSLEVEKEPVIGEDWHMHLVPVVMRTLFSSVNVRKKQQGQRWEGGL